MNNNLLFTKPKCKICQSKQVSHSSKDSNHYCYDHVPNHIKKFRKLCLLAMLCGRQKRLKRLGV